MALKAEGTALDCFEVTLKCEEGEDEEEAMVVAVIPRPEPMLRGEDGRGPHFRVTIQGSFLPPTQYGPGHPLPFLGMGFTSRPGSVWARCALAPPPPGFGISGLPEFPPPPPRVWSLRSTPAALRIFWYPSTPSPGPVTRGRIPVDTGCLRPWSPAPQSGGRPSGQAVLQAEGRQGLQARDWVRQPGVQSSSENRGRRCCLPPRGF